MPSRCIWTAIKYFPQTGRRPTANRAGQSEGFDLDVKDFLFRRRHRERWDGRKITKNDLGDVGMVQSHTHAHTDTHRLILFLLQSACCPGRTQAVMSTNYCGAPPQCHICSLPVSSPRFVVFPLVKPFP